MGFQFYRGAISAPASILMGASDRSPARLERSLRQAVESEIERLIDMLDAIEPDADLEPYIPGYEGDDREGDDADDEPSLGFLNDRPGRGAESASEIATGYGSADLEHDDCDDEDTDHSGAGDHEGLLEQEKGEDELGWTSAIDQTTASRIHNLDGVRDGEPSLGWTHSEALGVYRDEAGRDDREDDAGDNPEHDPAEFGIADMDGAFEQTGRAG